MSGEVAELHAKIQQWLYANVVRWRDPSTKLPVGLRLEVSPDAYYILAADPDAHGPSAHWNGSPEELLAKFRIPVVVNPLLIADVSYRLVIVTEEVKLTGVLERSKHEVDRNSTL